MTTDQMQTLERLRIIMHRIRVDSLKDGEVSKSMLRQKSGEALALLEEIRKAN